jgi:hypothetical protein
VKDDRQIQLLSQRILVQCAEMLGGTVELAKHLQVSHDQLMNWLEGKSIPSAEIILKAVDPLVAPHGKQ